MSTDKPGVTTRSNREVVDQRGHTHIEQVGARLGLLQAIADRLDSNGILVSDLQLGQALTKGEITLRVHDLAALLGIPSNDPEPPAGHRQDDGRETT